jgi:hypothetical protein
MLGGALLFGGGSRRGVVSLSDSNCGNAGSGVWSRKTPLVVIDVGEGGELVV